MKRDWKKIATDYIANGKTCEEISKTYNIAAQTVRRHCAQEHWVEQRDKYATEVAHRARAKAMQQKSRRQSQTLELVEKMTERLAKELMRAMKDPKQLYWQLVGSGPGKQQERALQKIDTRAAKDFVACMVGINELLQSLGGSMTAKDKAQIEMAGERLKLEREKFQAAQNQGGAEDALQIIIEEPAEIKLEAMLASLTEEERERLKSMLEG